MLIEIPPKYAVASIVGFMKGKSTIAILRQLCNKERNFTGEHFWARGYFVSTVGLNEEQIKKYIREQEGIGEQTEGSF
jgi:putative transposase